MTLTVPYQLGSKHVKKVSAYISKIKLFQLIDHRAPQFLETILWRLMSVHWLDGVSLSRDMTDEEIYRLTLFLKINWPTLRIGLMLLSVYPRNGGHSSMFSSAGKAWSATFFQLFFTTNIAAADSLSDSSSWESCGGRVDLNRCPVSYRNGWTDGRINM